MNVLTEEPESVILQRVSNAGDVAAGNSEAHEGDIGAAVHVDANQVNLNTNPKVTPSANPGGSGVVVPRSSLQDGLGDFYDSIGCVSPAVDEFSTGDLEASAHVNTISESSPVQKNNMGEGAAVVDTPAKKPRAGAKKCQKKS